MTKSIIEGIIKSKTVKDGSAMLELTGDFVGVYYIIARDQLANAVDKYLKIDSSIRVSGILNNKSIDAEKIDILKI